MTPMRYTGTRRIETSHYGVNFSPLKGRQSLSGWAKIISGPHHPEA